MKASREIFATTGNIRVNLDFTRWEIQEQMAEAILHSAINLAAAQIAEEFIERDGGKIARKLAHSVVLKEAIKEVALRLPTKRHANAN